MSEPCGCVVVNENTRVSGVLGIRPRITFCPLHEAAPQMYSRLASVAHYANLVANGTLNYPDKAAVVSNYRREFRAISDAIRSTLVAVDGKDGKQEPADDSEMPLVLPDAPWRRGLES